MTGPYTLREEARKSWDYTISNECVYLCHSPAGNFKTAIPLTEDYLHRDRWMEVHLFFGTERQVHFVVIIEAHPFNWRTLIGKLGVKSCRMYRDDVVLVNVPETMQLPQETVLKGCPSIIRLKRFDNCPCISRDFKDHPTLAFSLPETLGSITNRKPRAVRASSREQRQLKSQLIEGGSDTVHEITDKKGCDNRGFLELNPNDIPLILKIIPTREFIWFSLDKSREFGIEGIQMGLRPSHFQFGVFQAGAAESNTGDNRGAHVPEIITPC